MIKNGYKKICKISISLADLCIFIQNGTLLPTGISFPKNIPQVERDTSSPGENRIAPQTEGQLPAQILPQVGAELFSIPWEHHKYIIDKCSSDPDKALFYVRQKLENGWRFLS